ncbi:MAG: hypothetical protein UU70_C0005G0002 [Candidatus Yanofskybacteria bacterium GW2011_GWA1_41_6]|uniref:Uncharacterized protein n=1 Tax=Candidatus Yanofskybacteria bacterium GW2011_GWA1_41_6 TaxID=1619020 RepID=A0A0G0WM61_9BACT|nr:MAG: hypothetical protein UU70_C0005G0002 [Candidatus Yanofskybacteria bacterium GW2011_GWA1_41_6]
MKESFPLKITEKEPKLSREKVEENLKRSKDTGHLLEQAYWEAVKEGSVEHHIEFKGEATKPPIGSDEIFDPKKELEEIKTTPKEERKQKLQEFKEKLAYQKEGLARTQEQLVSVIRDNPDISWSELYKKALDLLIKYGADTQENKVKHILGKYYWRHRAIKEARDKFPDKNKLFEEIFGRPPRGKIEVVEGPVTLYFRCHNIKDYALISQQTFLDYRDPSFSERRVARAEEGISISTSLIPNLQGTIIAERAKGEFKDNQKKIYVHEEQHTIKRLFDERPVRELKPYKTGASLAEQFRMRRERIAELRVKDEILAFMKDGQWNPKDIFNFLTMPGKNGGLYDYLGEEIKKIIAIYSRSKDKKEVKEIAETAKQIFIDDYRELIRNGIKAFQDLIDNGYSTEQTIALLNAEPLAKWSKIVKRLIQKQAV